MIKLKIQICSVALLTGALLCGQTPTPPSAAQMAEWRVNHLTSVLSLTAAQQSQAKTIFGNESSNTNLRTSLEAAHKALEAAVEANDTAAIAAQSAQIGTLTAQETQERATVDAAFYAILNTDQQTKYKEMLTHRPGGRGPGHGFGGGAMPPPPGD